MQGSIAVLPGDGVAEEIVPQAVKVVQAVANRFGHRFTFTHGLLGGIALDKTGNPLPQESVDMARAAGAVLHGAVGGPQWDYATGNIAPVQSRRMLQKKMNQFINVRPVKVFPALADATVMKPEVLQDANFVVVRDYRMLIDNIETGAQEEQGGRLVWDRISSHEQEVLQMLKLCVALARSRRKKLALMTQASVYGYARLWSTLAAELAKQTSDVEIEVMAWDNCAAQLLRDPRQFDVILCSEVPSGGMINSLGALLMGSVGMAPSATLGMNREALDGGDVYAMVKGPGFYEPIHGSAPLRAGQWVVNPIGTILAAAMMLEYSFGLVKEARAIEEACGAVLERYRTYDVMAQGKTKVGTAEMGDHIAEAMAAQK